MLAQVIKRETKDFLHLSLTMFVDRVELLLNKQLCLKCDVCALVCPRGAVSVIPGEAALEISIDPRLCLLCEVCAHFCPVGAVTLSYNGQPKAILAAHQGLAPFFPQVRMDQEKCVQPCREVPQGEEHWCRRELKLIANAPEACPKRCHKCLEACPRQAIRLDEAGAQTMPQPDLCLRCAQCLEVCEYGAIEVTPQFLGSLNIDDGKCPPDCQLCIDLCPVKAIVREGPRVFLKTATCSYCGVCTNICDQGAITLIREEVVAQPGEFSLAWVHAVAKLLEI
jgi:4Fe-4S ferredoxin